MRTLIGAVRQKAASSQEEQLLCSGRMRVVPVCLESVRVEEAQWQQVRARPSRRGGGNTVASGRRLPAQSNCRSGAVMVCGRKMMSQSKSLVWGCVAQVRDTARQGCVGSQRCQRASLGKARRRHRGRHVERIRDGLDALRFTPCCTKAPCALRLSLQTRAQALHVIAQCRCRCT